MEFHSERQMVVNMNGKKNKAKDKISDGKKNKNVNDVALIRHLATSNIANFMWYNFLLVKK